MIIVLDKSATPEQIQIITSKLESGGYQAHPIYGVEKIVIGAVGVPEEEKPGLREQFEALPFVEQVITILAPYKL
ncbi:MAG: 3-deoxy-7-phosphoheptulonate synthase, partial [bacterium]|nr:3-deoxy-7-phosphoheptulonate synthase [bacterium]